MSEIFRENSVMLCGKWTNNMWGGLDWKQVHGSPRNWVVCKDSWVAARSLFVKSLAQTIQSKAARESHDIRNSVVLFIDKISVLRMNSPICGWLRLVKPRYLHIYIYIALIVKINITHTHFLHVTLTHAEITPVFAGKKVMLIFQHLVQHLKSWLVESPHLHKTI